MLQSIARESYYELVYVKSILGPEILRKPRKSKKNLLPTPYTEELNRKHEKFIIFDFKGGH